jgi:hypothetical protein
MVAAQALRSADPRLKCPALMLLPSATLLSGLDERAMKHGPLLQLTVYSLFAREAKGGLLSDDRPA